MYRLQKLELNGFKSFSSPTEFTFEPGITAVVGPNGCGKSNIADAITWVIGEQSTKSLRAEHMGDVIFNGSDTRRPMGMAEVSLHLAGTPDAPKAAHPPAIEAAVVPEAEPAPIVEGIAAEAEGDGNGNGHLEHAMESDGRSETTAPPVPAERTEIVITRRLFRSGESEYLIDGRKCRLRDIQELLAEIHVGSGLFSVIEQGRVESIITSRPRDRRLIIEEAAGIALYKVRKRQAQSKLEATEANLLRINDIVSEIERQIGALKRQAARARRYARIAASIERGERILFHHEERGLDSLAGTLRDRRIEIQEEESEAAAGIARADAALEAAREVASEAAAGHQSARESLHALDRALDQLKAAVERWREQEAEAQSQMARGEAEAESIRGRLASIRERRDAASVELTDAAAESAKAERAVLDREAEIRLDAANLQATQAALAAAREESISAAGALSECRNEMRRLEDASSRSRGEEARLDRLLSEVVVEAAALIEKMRAQQSGAEEIQTSARRTRLEAEDASRALKEMESRRESLLLDREEKRGRMKAIEERLHGLGNLESTPEGAWMGSGTENPLRILKDVISAPESLDRAIDAALDGLLRGYLTPSIGQAAAIVETLKARGRGRAILIPLLNGGGGLAVAPAHAPGSGAPGLVGTLDALVRLPEEAVPALAPILRRVAVAADLSSGLALHSALEGFDIVTLQGDLVSRDGWVEGGAEVPEEAGVMTLKRLLERLAQDAAGTRERIAVLDGEIAAAERDLVTLREGARAWSDRVSDLSREEESLKVQGESLLAEEARLDLRRQAHGGDLARIREDLEALHAARDRTIGFHELALKRHDELQRAVEALAGSAEALRDALQVRSADVSVLRGAAVSAREKRGALEAEIRHIAETEADLDQRLVREGEEKVRWEARLDETRVRLDEDTRTLSDRMAERILAEGLVASAEAALLEKKGELPGHEEAVRAARLVLDEARERLHALELEEERLAGDRRGLESRVRERGLPSLAAATESLTEEEKATEPEVVRAEMAVWKEKRDAMGAVNLMAVDQFRELEERHSFITTQRRDLNESIQSLKETIARINRQSRERFMDAFEKIRIGFADIFRTLFSGGRADLRLVTEGGEDGDLLEAGLEISVQPPGKRLQSISLLSGGEKALTATALLFAIFRYSPSPFCLLDEVDAPLDEANVLRFNSLLATMSDETQFIMITHNRRSMEAAGLLYGITMEEPGVSRTVSVVMASDEDRKEAARTLPALLASRHRGSRGRSLPAGPPRAAGYDA